MKVTRSVQPEDVSPRGEAVTFDGKHLITADKETSDITVFSTPKLQVELKKHVGDNPSSSRSILLVTAFLPPSSRALPAALPKRTRASR